MKTENQTKHTKLIIKLIILALLAIALFTYWGTKKASKNISCSDISGGESPIKICTTLGKLPNKINFSKEPKGVTFTFYDVRINNTPGTLYIYFQKNKVIGYHWTECISPEYVYGDRIDEIKRLPKDEQWNLEKELYDIQKEKNISLFYNISDTLQAEGYDIEDKTSTKKLLHIYTKGNNPKHEYYIYTFTETEFLDITFSIK